MLYFTKPVRDGGPIAGAGRCSAQPAPPIPGREMFIIPEGDPRPDRQPCSTTPLPQHPRKDALEIASVGKGGVHRMVCWMQVVGEDAGADSGAGGGAADDLEEVVLGYARGAGGRY